MAKSLDKSDAKKDRTERAEKAERPERDNGRDAAATMEKARPMPGADATNPDS